MISTILKVIAAALPGLVGLVQAFRKKPVQQTESQVAKKAADEIVELENWKKATQ